jgi:alanyl-tRNA synthetase
VPELKHIESISQGWIAENVRVFSKELDLATAQRIPGLRAVFGETYPNPVRVVVLRWDVDEIAKDIENPQWRSTSVEFCGGTYVWRRLVTVRY